MKLDIYNQPAWGRTHYSALNDHRVIQSHGMNQKKLILLILYSAFIFSEPKLTGVADPASHIIHCELFDAKSLATGSSVENSIDYFNSQLILRLATDTNGNTSFGISFKNALHAWPAISQIGLFYVCFQHASSTPYATEHSGSIRVSSDSSHNTFIDPSERFTESTGKPHYRHIKIVKPAQLFSQNQPLIEITLFPVFTGHTFYQLNQNEEKLICIDRLIPSLSLHLTAMTEFSLITREAEWKYKDQAYQVRTGIRLMNRDIKQGITGIKIPEKIFEKNNYNCSLFYISPDKALHPLCNYRKHPDNPHGPLVGDFPRPDTHCAILHFHQVFGTSKAVSISEVKKDLLANQASMRASLSTCPVKYDHTNSPALSLVLHPDEHSTFLHLFNPLSLKTVSMLSASDTKKGIKYTGTIFPKGTEAAPDKVRIKLKIQPTAEKISGCHQLQGMFFRFDPFPSPTRQVRHMAFSSLHEETESCALAAMVDICTTKQIDPDKTGQACFKILPVYTPKLTAIKVEDGALFVSLIIDATTLELHRSGLFELESPVITHENLPALVITFKSSGYNRLKSDKMSISVHLTAPRESQDELETITFSHTEPDTRGKSMTGSYTHLAQLEAGCLAVDGKKETCPETITGDKLMSLVRHNQLQIDIKFKFKSSLPAPTDQPFVSSGSGLHEL